MLPQNTQLGELKLSEVYYYYDQPVFFLCQNQTETEVFYLVLLIDSEEDYDLWFYSITSKNQLEDLKAKRIDIKTAIVENEAVNPFLFVVIIWYDSNKQENVIVDPITDIGTLDPESLPEAKQYLGQ